MEHSSEYAALDRIMTEMDKSNTPINISLDCSKAFDTLDHKIFPYKINYSGINGASLKLMQSYFTYQKQYVDFHDTHSEILTLITIVLQGYVLEHLLLLIYIYDSAQAGKLFDIDIDANDTVLSTNLEPEDYPNSNCRRNT